MKNAYTEAKFCVATLYLPEGIRWKSAYVSCDTGSVCYIVSDVPGLEVNELFFIESKGNGFHVYLKAPQSCMQTCEKLWPIDLITPHLLVH